MNILTYAIFLVISFCSSKAFATNPTQQSAFNTHNLKNISNDTLIKDTLTYFKQEFMTKKEKYLNQPLDSILNNLKIPVKSYISSGAHNNKFIVPGISLSFCNSNETEYRVMSLAKKPVIVWIKWETPLPKDSIHALLIKKETNRRDWGNDERAYFGKQIVKDFGFVDFKQ